MEYKLQYKESLLNNVKMLNAEQLLYRYFLKLNNNFKLFLQKFLGVKTNYIQRHYTSTKEDIYLLVYC